MAKNEYQRLIFEILGTRPIAFNPILARITGSVKAGLLLSQLLYWYQKGRDKDWFYKSNTEITEETALTRREIDNAVNKLKQLKIIEVKVKGVPAKRHFKINLEHIDKKLSSCTVECNQLHQTAKLVAPLGATNTDNTPNNTADIQYLHTGRNGKILRKIFPIPSSQENKPKKKIEPVFGENGKLESFLIV